jgi:hypothetical protein
MAKAEDVVIKIRTDDGQVAGGLNSTERKLNSFGDKVQRNVGAAVAAAFATRAIMNFGREVMELAAIQQRAEAKVEQAIKQTGMAAGFSAGQLKRMASELQSITTFGDERILNDVTAQLLSFTNITGTNFERAQKAVMDVATLLDGDLKSAAIQVGKALNDPTTALSALTRSGIQFTAAQKEQINSLIASNQLFEAQSIILGEIERQYGGQAEAMAKLPLGKLEQQKNIWGDIKENIGKAIIQSDLFANSLTALQAGTKVMASEQLSFWQKFLALTDITGQRIGFVVAASEALQAAQDELNETNDKSANFMAKGVMLAKQSTEQQEKQVKTIGELKAETEALKQTLEGYGVNQGAEIQRTLSQIEANEKLIKSLTTLRTKRAEIPGMGSMTTRTDLPTISYGPGLWDNVQNLELDKLTQHNEAWTERYKELMKERQDEVDAINQEFNSRLADSLAGGIAAAFSGQGLEGVLVAFLNPLADFLMTEGTMLIAHGLAVEAFKKSLQSLNGIGAIAAGAAMVATAGIFKGFVNKGISGSGAGYSTGGGGYGSSGGFGTNIGKQAIDITGRFEVDGNNLVYILNKTSNTNSRTRR